MNIEFTYRYIYIYLDTEKKTTFHHPLVFGCCRCRCRCRAALLLLLDVMSRLTTSQTGLLERTATVELVHPNTALVVVVKNTCELREVNVGISGVLYGQLALVKLEHGSFHTNLCVHADLLDRFAAHTQGLGLILLQSSELRHVIAGCHAADLL